MSLTSTAKPSSRESADIRYCSLCPLTLYAGDLSGGNFRFWPTAAYHFETPVKGAMRLYASQGHSAGENLVLSVEM
jgi:hypothetical protein